VPAPEPVPKANDRRVCYAADPRLRRWSPEGRAGSARELGWRWADAGFAVAVHHHRSARRAEGLVAEIARAGGTAVAPPPTWPTRLP